MDPERGTEDCKQSTTLLPSSGRAWARQCIAVVSLWERQLSLLFWGKVSFLQKQDITPTDKRREPLSGSP